MATVTCSCGVSIMLVPSDRGRQSTPWSGPALADCEERLKQLEAKGRVDPNFECDRMKQAVWQARRAGRL